MRGPGFALFLCFFLAVLLAYPQERESFSVGYTHQARFEEVPLKDNSWRVLLRRIPCDSRWVIGARTPRKENSRMAVIEGELTTPPAKLKRGPMIAGMRNLSKGRIQNSPGLTEVLGPVSDNVALLVYAELPQGTNVSVGCEDRVLLTAPTSPTLLVYRGRILPHPVVGLGTLTQTVNENGLAPRAPKGELVRTPDGLYHLTSRGLTSHLITPTMPSYPFGVPTPRNRVFAAPRLGIDEAGNVKSVVRVMGDETLLALCEQAVRDWKFRPFLLDGKPIPVSSAVSFHYHPAFNRVTLFISISRLRNAGPPSQFSGLGMANKALFQHSADT
jgi:hypothetical protein